MTNVHLYICGNLFRTFKRGPLYTQGSESLCALRYLFVVALALCRARFAFFLSLKFFSGVKY